MSEVLKMSVMVISTAHIGKHDAQALQERSGPSDTKDLPAPYRLTSASDEHGFWVFSGWTVLHDEDEAPALEYLLQAEDEGYSPDFVAVLARAQLNECAYVRFDKKGPVYDGLRTFEW